MFAPATTSWFGRTYGAPTEAQLETWAAIRQGHHVVVSAPTGSGKTLAAFLWSIDQLLHTPPPEDPARACRVLYISPLKALAADIERNLATPLAGIRHEDPNLPQLRVGVRTADTPASERRRFGTKPPDIFITTPESLFLVLNSAARTGLAGVELVIVDEIHALVSTKRGAHLAVSLSRLDEMLNTPAQRIGLSATAGYLKDTTRFLTGADSERPFTIVAPHMPKHFDITVSVPVADMTQLGPAGAGGEASTGGRTPEPSIWPHVERSVADLIERHQSTIVFTNSRRGAERLTARLNEEWAGRHGPDLPRPGGTNPAGLIGLSGAAVGAPPVLARAHHGSMSHVERRLTEEELKAGRLPAVVATSSLELGIDMGAVDLVVQVGAPPTVASAVQRIGRAGHQVGAPSTGVIFPTHRGDLLAAWVVAERARSGWVEDNFMLTNPLDVLAQQIIAMCAGTTWHRAHLARVIRRASPFVSLGEESLNAVLDMVSGRFPSEDFAGLKARVVWDRTADTLTGRPGAAMLVNTSGGTIPDRGLYPVYLTDEAAADTRTGKRVGELDEEMVFESRAGDVITLGSTSWLIESIDNQRVLVSPAPGVPGRLPFWTGDTQGRPYDLGNYLGIRVRELADALDGGEFNYDALAGLDDLARRNLTDYLREQLDATGVLPDNNTIVVEHFRDELGDWRVVIHSLFGNRVNAPWALLIAAERQILHVEDIKPMSADDGIVFRWPTGDQDRVRRQDIVFELKYVYQQVARHLARSALFASRFRQAAARALVLPRMRPGERQPLWLQRHRAAQLFGAASQFPNFPVVAEAMRECLHDDYDIDALCELMAAIKLGHVRIVEVFTPRPSPFAASLLFGYTGQFLYEGDLPLAERRAAALAIDPALLAELLGTAEQVDPADLLDEDVVAAVDAELTGLTHPARSAEQLADVLARHGPLTDAELAERAEPAWPTWRDELVAAHRAFQVPGPAGDLTASAEDGWLLREGLPAPSAPPTGTQRALPRRDLIVRHLATRAVTTAAEIASRFGWPELEVADILHDLVEAEVAVQGRLTRHAAAREFCAADTMRTLRRRSLAALRAQIEPVSHAQYAAFLPRRQHIGQLRGTAGLLQAVADLAGVLLPPAVWESLILPARVTNYAPHLLDEVIGSGQVVWTMMNGEVALHPRATAALTVIAPCQEITDELELAVLGLLGAGGGHFVDDLAERLAEPVQSVKDALDRLAATGHVTNDSFDPVRRVVRSRRAKPKGRVRPRPLLGSMYATDPGGRWSLTPRPSADQARQLAFATTAVLDRYGLITRTIAARAGVKFDAIYRYLVQAEERGQMQRGYFVAELGAAQFSTTAAVEDMRADHGNTVHVLAAIDPANPYGAIIPWPKSTAELSAVRRDDAVIVLVGGELVLYLHSGARTLLRFSSDAHLLARAASGLADVLSRGVLRRTAISKIDGEAALNAEDIVMTALVEAGFVRTPAGLRVRM